MHQKEINSIHNLAYILHDYPKLAGCKRFQPSAALISHIMDVITQNICINPMEVNNSVLTNPGQIIS